MELPEDHDEQLAFEEQWMNAAMSRGALPIPRIIPSIPQGVGHVHPLADHAPMSQDSQADATHILPSQAGGYHFHVPVIQTVSTIHNKFKFKDRSKAMENAPVDALRKVAADGCDDGDGFTPSAATADAARELLTSLPSFGDGPPCGHVPLPPADLGMPPAQDPPSRSASSSCPASSSAPPPKRVKV